MCVFYTCGRSSGLHTSQICVLWWSYKGVEVCVRSSLNRSLQLSNPLMNRELVLLVILPLPRLSYPTHVILPSTPLAIKTLVLTIYTHTSLIHVILLIWLELINLAFRCSSSNLDESFMACLGRCQTLAFSSIILIWASMEFLLIFQKVNEKAK